MVRWLDASNAAKSPRQNHPHVCAVHRSIQPAGSLRVRSARVARPSHKSVEIVIPTRESITAYRVLALPRGRALGAHFESSSRVSSTFVYHDPLIRVYIYNTCASGVYSTRAELSISSSYRAAISEPVPVVVRDSAVSSGHIRACPSTVVAEPQRRLEHATQIPFLAQSSAVIRGVLLCPKWKLLLPKVEVIAAQSGSSVPLCGEAGERQSQHASEVERSICSQSLNCGAHQRA